MRLNKPISLLLFYLFFTGGLYAQVSKSKLLFYHISEKDGLSDNLVNCFFQDSKGIMWMGTSYGLNNFDGSVVNVWQADNATGDDRMKSNQVNGITEDDQHTIWMATAGGLTSLDPATNSIHTYQSVYNNTMRGLAREGNKLWIATEGGLLLFDITEKSFRHFINNMDDHREFVNFDNDINSLTIDSKKRLWLATVNGVWMFDRKKQFFEQYDGVKNDTEFDGMANTVFEDHKGRIWIGCWSKGMKQIIPETRQTINYHTIKGAPTHVMTMVEQKTIDNHYSMWISDNLTSFKEPFDKFEHNDLKPIIEAASLDPHCLYVSRDNLLWISTVKGVYILDPTRQLFKHHFISTQPNITNQEPAIFYQNNKLWIGGDKNLTLVVYDDAFNVIKNYTATIRNLGGEYAQDAAAVLNIVPFGKNELLLATSAGVLSLNLTTDKISILCHKVNETGQYPYNFINNIYINNGKIWAFPWRRGIWEYDPVTKKFSPLVIKLPDSNEKPKGVNVADVVTDDIGNTWLADLDYGLVKYTPATKKFERFIDGNITPYSRVLNIDFVGGKLWVVDNTTIVAIDPKTNLSEGWPLPTGMNKVINEYTLDGRGNMWIATKTGLVVFNMITHAFNQYTEEDGLINNDMNGNLRSLPNGKILFVGENYFTSFTPQELLRKPAKKRLLLTGVNADDHSVSTQYIIPAGSRKVTFNWALINYTNPLQNRYYGKLDKIDKDWNYVGNKGSINYNSLPAGTYTFRYKAATSDGLVSAEKHLVFIIKPPFWKSWWFETLLVLFAASSLVFIIRNERRRERKKAAIKLQLSDLEMRALRAQMNPHFIFNALNSIQECIVSKNTKAAYTYLSSFSKLVRMILENSEKQFITLEAEIETLRLYLSLEKLRFNDDFEFDIQTDANIHPSFIRIPTMIIQPFAENALWHGLIHKKGDKKLTISFKQEKGVLLCLIEDNGVGRVRSAEFKTINGTQKQSMGIKITEERLALLQNEAAIKIDDLEQANGEASGTKITISIPLQF
ncbi:sensor histidine kinase [Mucilaginibacter flavus]|uniref:sensor histidine kinase n=1 Tax=Mucilaginibacter flavus TaxID=931504 RepID=UPI0025B4FD8C|nr:sensor histidine kinase [Mucilaginibacter flavus]MDN3582443.1 histidine kinase [Mucilaginibacter flavus]